jgi:hypothetical protein
MLPGVVSGSGSGYSGSGSGSDKIPLRRLGRTDRMVSCIGFGSGSRYCNWVADDVILQKHIDHAIDLGIIAIKIMGQNALIGNVTGDDLLRYALTLPFTVANVGMDGFAPLESCVEVAREPLLSVAEAEKIRIKLNFDPKVTRLPYFIG